MSKLVRTFITISGSRRTTETQFPAMLQKSRCAIFSLPAFKVEGLKVRYLRVKVVSLVRVHTCLVVSKSVLVNKIILSPLTTAICPVGKLLPKEMQIVWWYLMAL